MNTYRDLGDPPRDVSEDSAGLSRRMFLGATAATGMALALGACSSSSDSGKEQKNSKKELQEVSFMLDYLPAPPSTWLYVAINEGYFEEEGIKVNVKSPPLTNLTAPVQYTAAGKIDLAMGEPTTIVQARNKSAPILSVANLIGQAANGLISLPDKPVEEPGDLVGETVANYDNPSYKAMLDTFLDYGGVVADQVEVVYPTYTPALLSTGKAIGAVGYYYGERVNVESEAAAKPIWAAFTDFGVPPFPNSALVTSEKFAEANPEILRGFITASMRGMKKSFVDPDATKTAIKEFSEGVQKTSELDANLAKFEALRPYWMPPGVDPDVGPFAVQDPDAWKEMDDWAIEYELISETPDLSSFITDKYITASAKHPVV